jgi:4a-hydroxytetrahydrobiopterin dehydratase
MTEWIRWRPFQEAVAADGWRVVGEGACAYFRTGSLEEGVRFAQAISELPGLDAHHPDIDLRHDGVTVRLVTITEDSFGLSDRDLELAGTLSTLAREQGLTADPSNVQTFQLAIDALVIPEVLPFWRAVLGYVDRDDGGEDLLDPRGRGPLIWFQRMDAPRPQRNRIHVDIWVPHDEAEARVKAALAAGGTLVTDTYVPSWWTLADAEGNECDVCTWQEEARGG